MNCDVKLDGVSIKHQVSRMHLHKGRMLFCKELTLTLNDKAFLDQFDFTQIPTEPRIEVLTHGELGWISEGVFFVEEPGTAHDKDKIVHTLYGRDISAKLTFPFAARISRSWGEETTRNAIIQEILEEAGLEYDESRILIDDFTIYAGSYSVTNRYPLEIIQELIGKTDGFLYTDRLGQIWVLKDEHSWSDVETTIHGGQIQNITTKITHPEFGNRIKVGSYSNENDANVSISLEMASSYVACGEGVTAKAVVTHKDGTPVADGYPVDWTTDVAAYAAWENARTHVYTHRITNEAQEATSRYQISTDYPIRQVYSVTEVATGATKNVSTIRGRTITLSEPLTYTDSAVIIDYETGYATNTLVAGVTGEVEVDVHAIVEMFVRDTATIRVDTLAGNETAEQAAYVTVVTRDFVTKEIITAPGAVRLHDVLKGQTGDGIIDLGLVPGGEHPISVRDVSGYKDTDEANEGLANDTIRVGQTVYETSEGEETTNPNIITDHNDLSNIQGGTTGQRYHLTAAELAALSTYATITAVNAAIASHANLDTGVHGAGADTLATDADIVAAIASHVLEEDPHSQYFMASGVSGGQTAIGGTGSGDDLTLQSTAHATKGSILFGTSAYDEVNNRLGLGLTAPNEQLELTANMRLAPTTVSTIGVIQKGANRFIHDFAPAGANGGNLFFGELAGNFTMAISGSPLHCSKLTGLGNTALYSNTTGYNIVAIGTAACYSNTSGNGIVAIGPYSCEDNTTGYNIVSIGANSTRNNVSGDGIVSIGASSLDATQSKSNLVSIGSNAMMLSTGAEGTNAIGSSVLRYNVSGKYEVVNGIAGFYYKSSGNYNCGIGAYVGFGASGASNVTGNVLFGYKAGYALRTGADYNVLIGYQAGDNITTGARCIIIGKDIDAPVAAGNDQLAIGGAIYGDLATGAIEFEKEETLTGNLADGYSSSLALDPSYTGAFTVTRHNYLDIQNPATAGGAAVTDAAVMRFDAAIGVHTAVLAAFQTTDSNGDTTNWAGGVQININGTLYKIPIIAV